MKTKCSYHTFLFRLYKRCFKNITFMISCSEYHAVDSHRYISIERIVHAQIIWEVLIYIKFKDLYRNQHSSVDVVRVKINKISSFSYCMKDLNLWIKYKFLIFPVIVLISIVKNEKKSSLELILKCVQLIVRFFLCKQFRTATNKFLQVWRSCYHYYDHMKEKQILIIDRKVWR